MRSRPKRLRAVGLVSVHIGFLVVDLLHNVTWSSSIPTAIEEVHIDTRQFNHIVWSDPANSPLLKCALVSEQRALDSEGCSPIGPVDDDQTSKHAVGLVMNHPLRDNDYGAGFVTEEASNGPFPGMSLNRSIL